MTEFNIGDKVMFINKDAHETHPEYYPCPGVIGMVKCVDSMDCTIQWPKGTTSLEDSWCASNEDLKNITIEGCSLCKGLTDVQAVFVNNRGVNMSFCPNCGRDMSKAKESK